VRFVISALVIPGACLGYGLASILDDRWLCVDGTTSSAADTNRFKIFGEIY
jgi:hypothetical protein